MSNPELFARVVQKLPLLDTDKLSLLSKRGFSYEVIERMAFRSCGDFLQHDPYGAFYSQLPQEFQDAFKKANIVIPYPGPDGSWIHIRPHKFGIKDLPIQIYVPYPYLGKDLSTMVVAESEFKALASCIMGVPAVGVPGIASVSRARFNMLSDILQALGCKRAVVCFDNEVKNDPKLPSYKEDYTKRYDTLFYSFIIATLLKKAGIDGRVAFLKDDWRVDGKADIDGVLAAGIDHSEYQKVIDRSIAANAFKERWAMPLPHRSYLERRIERFFYEGPISEKFDSYYTNGRGGESRISNFTIKILHTLHDQAGSTTRLCRFVSTYGNSRPIKITPDAMASKGAFQKFCYEAGDYEFGGDDKQLQFIWRYIFMNQDGRIVFRLKTYGYDEASGIWFFGNGAYLNDKLHPVDENGIVWVNDIGYKIPESLESIDIPFLAASDGQGVELKEIVKRLGGVIGENPAKIIVGWALGSFFMPEIIAEYRNFPFLFLYGKKEGGKSTIANWISAFFGFAQKGVNFHTSSIVGISRLSSQLSMIPVWLEEYRNKDDPDIGKKNNFLRSIYDKSAIVKGTKREDEIKTYRPRSTLLISGEEYPKDAALNSRCFMVPVYRQNNDRATADKDYEWLQANKGFFNAIGHTILVNKAKTWPVIKERIREYMSSFDENQIKIGDRNRLQMSILAGIVDVMTGESDSFSEFVGDTAENHEIRVNANQALYVFLEDICNLISSNKIKVKVIERKVSKDSPSVLLLWFSMAYSEWEMYYKGLRNDIPTSKAALLEHLKREPYYLDSKQSRVGGNSVYAIHLDFSRPELPAVLRNIVANQEEGNHAGLFDMA